MPVHSCYTQTKSCIVQLRIFEYLSSCEAISVEAQLPARGETRNAENHPNTCFSTPSDVSRSFAGCVEPVKSRKMGSPLAQLRHDANRLL